MYWYQTDSIYRQQIKAIQFLSIGITFTQKYWYSVKIYPKVELFIS